MTIPAAPVSEETELSHEEEVEAISDSFRHIVCLMCFPAFAEQTVAPHDAECICGKPVHAGELQAPDTAPECVLCHELADGHYRRKHAKR